MYLLRMDKYIKLHKAENCKMFCITSKSLKSNCSLNKQIAHTF